MFISLLASQSESVSEIMLHFLLLLVFFLFAWLMKIFLIWLKSYLFASEKIYGRFKKVFCENLRAQIQKLHLMQHLDLQGINHVKFVSGSVPVSTSGGKEYDSELMCFSPSCIICKWALVTLFIVPFML